MIDPLTDRNHCVEPRLPLIPAADPPATQHSTEPRTALSRHTKRRGGEGIFRAFAPRLPPRARGEAVSGNKASVAAPPAAHTAVVRAWSLGRTYLGAAEADHEADNRVYSHPVALYAVARHAYAFNTCLAFKVLNEI